MELHQHIMTVFFVIIIFTVRISESAKGFEFEYHLDESWPHVSVANMQVYGSAVAVDVDNNVVLLHRGLHGTKRKSFIDDNPVVIVDHKSGKIIREWGSNKFLKPHGLTLTRTQAIFITDVVMHQVFKFERDNETKLWKNEASIVLGELFVPGYDNYHFCSPTDVQEDLDGNFFVADGYCHARVVKFDSEGKYLLQFGAASDNPLLPPLRFNVTHAILLAYGTETIDDLLEPSSMVLVADRNNARVQTFTTTGSFMYEIGPDVFGPGMPMVLSLDIVPEISSRSKTPKDFKSKYEFGIAYIIKGNLPVGQSKVYMIGLHATNFTVISTFPISSEIVFNNSINCTQPLEVEIETPHDIAVSEDKKSIYIVQASDNLILKRFLNGPKPRLSAKNRNVQTKSNSNPKVVSCINLLLLLLSLLLIYSPFGPNY